MLMMANVILGKVILGSVNEEKELIDGQDSLKLLVSVL